jgi:hypothetical protein
MARLMEGPVTNEQIEAAQYLAETNDQSWYPLLRDAAEKNARISSYPAYAAELGGERCLLCSLPSEESRHKIHAPKCGHGNGVHGISGRNTSPAGATKESRCRHQRPR